MFSDAPARGRRVRSSGQATACPPKHALTDARVLVTQSSVGARHIELYSVDIHPGGAGFDDAHPGCEHGFFVLAGEGEALVNGERFALLPEDCLFIPDGATHSVKPVGDRMLRLLVFMAPHRNLAGLTK